LSFEVSTDLTHLNDGTRFSENEALRRIFGLKKDKVTGVWRKLHNEELHAH